jgi:hypothetical protein
MQPKGRIVMMSSEGEAMGKIDWSDLRCGYEQASQA